jgi:hypothetical protein
MKFGITQTTSFDVTNNLKSLNLISAFLDKKFGLRNYGTGLEIFVVGVNCTNPEVLIPPRDFETGFILDKKYTKSKKLLEFSVKLNYREVISTTEDKLVNIVTEALLKSYSEIESLNIKNFDIGKFYNDLKNLLQERTWLREPAEPSSPQLLKKERTTFSATEKIPEDSFWGLIEKARADSHGNLYNQIKLITDQLSKKEEKEIIGFECTLRELIMRAYHYNVMAVQKIIEGSVTEDSFLYFRCKLILYGRMTFENASSNPNYIFERIDSTITGEPLLTVADTAFKMKFGENTDKILPREYASGIIDYDFGEYEVQGKDWNEEDIPKRYSKLWKAYVK